MQHIRPLIGQHFAFASGRTGVLQQLLLTATDRDRLLGAADVHEAEAILTEISMTNVLDQGLKTADEILPALGMWIRTEVREMTPPSKLPVFHILWLEEDAPVLAYHLKKHHGLVAENSIPPASDLSVYGQEDKPSHLTEFLERMMKMEHPKPQDVDFAVAQYIASLKLKLARASGSKEILNFVRNSIDIANIRTALRGSDHLIVGGSIDPKDLCGTREHLLASIALSPLPYDLPDTIRRAAEDPNMLEHAFGEIIAHDIARMWNMPLSIEPVFAFAALAESQRKLLRAIFIGKRAGMSPQDIKRMLPPFLPASHYVLS